MATRRRGVTDAGAVALEPFHPEVRGWFLDTFSAPTAVQARSWPRISAGEHLLVTAPTGSGKTLTAFLWALDRLFSGSWAPGRVRVLYVSPLRALNTDIRRNLEQPLLALENRFRRAGLEPPGIRAMTRSGDTPQNERRRMMRHPPEILITTPESLNILLTSASGRALLQDLETVILDEIHAVFGSKRGTHLITAVDRLVMLSGEFQRIALSATVEPLGAVAELVGGWRLEKIGGAAQYRRRDVATVRAPVEKAYDVRVRFPAASRPDDEDTAGARPDTKDDGFWRPLVEACKKRIRANRSTLLFTNSRRMTEKITRLINEDETRELAWSHHGSLARELRAVVERRLKDGELAAIVATSSLELGIDVGALDEVLLVQTPRAASAGIQRIGRAGHGVGETSRGTFFPTHGRDLLDAAVLARCVLEQKIEPTAAIVAPLDVLAQVLLSMTATEPWSIDDLYDRIRTSDPYHGLSRRQFDLVLEMLAGRYADSRVRELRPRLVVDRVTHTVRARAGTARLLYMAGGTIPDRGYYALRVEGTKAKIGELDEEFVWERSVGDSFTLGPQVWQVRKITHNDVMVAPRSGRGAIAPFWRADAQDRGTFLSSRVAELLAAAEDRADDPVWREELAARHGLDTPATEALLAFLEAQRTALGGRLPHRRRLMVERVGDGRDEAEQERVILHSLWGGTVHRPFALALAAAWEARFETALVTYHDDDCILLLLPQPCATDDLLALVAPDQVELLLRRRLETTGFFGAAFREAASTALLLPRAGFHHRTPLWMSRQRAKKLLGVVAEYDDFPLMVETWRSCLQDAFDLEALRARLGELDRGEIEIHEVRTSTPSPFAANLIWQQTNQAMYEDDRSERPGASRLRTDLLQELVFSARLRPRLPAALVERFERTVQRRRPGYAPQPGDDLLAWIEERVALPVDEWRPLLEAIERDHGVRRREVEAGVAGRVVRILLPGASVAVLVRVEAVARLAALIEGEAADLSLASIDGKGPPSAEASTALRTLAEDASGRTTASEDDPLETMAGKGSGEADAAEIESRWADLISAWLRTSGSCREARLRAVFGAAPLDEALRLLAEAQQIVVDQLTAGREVLEICDAENLERMLRWLRLDARPTFEARPATLLPLMLAWQQGLAEPGEGVEGLQEALEMLMGWPAPAAAWEGDLLPARLEPYYAVWLDSLLQASELLWLGCGSGKLTFAFTDDATLFTTAGEGPEGSVPPPLGDESEDGEAAGDVTADRAVAWFPEAGARWAVAHLAAARGATPEALVTDLWQLAWRGQVSNDTFLAVRQGIEQRFAPTPSPAARRRRPGRDTVRRGGRWRPGGGYFGAWYRLESSTAGDALDAEQQVEDRVRVLLGRWGVLFRELLLRELAPLRWAAVFRTLRRMELSGEVLAGHFFEGVPGLQFMSHGAFRRLRDGLPEDTVYWLSATDPASVCGLDIEGLRGTLPARQATTRLAYHGTRLVLVSRRNGRHLDVRVAPDHPAIGAYLEPLKNLLARDSRPLASLEVRTINDEPAPQSPYLAVLRDHFRVTREPSAVKLWKRY